MLISSSLGTVELVASCLYAGGMAIVMTFLVRVGVASQNENRGATFYWIMGGAIFLLLALVS